MKLTIEPTQRQIEVEVTKGATGVPARVWEGVDEEGVPVILLVTRLAVRNDQPARVHDRFARELRKVPSAPSADAVQAFPLRMVL